VSIADDAEHEGSLPDGPKEPCPDCGGKKCLQRYTDGHSFCFKCEKVTGSVAQLKGVVGGMERDYGDLLDPGQQIDPWAPNAKRGIKSDTRRKYGTFTAGHAGGPVVVYPYYSQADELVAQKLRTAGKEFPVLKGPGYTALNDCRLFGHHVYGDKFDRQVVVCEGEEDALAVGQELNFKVAVVSVNGGAGNAAKSIKANYLWLDRFADIILWFDLDDEGQKAVKECAPLFKVGKVRVAKAFGFKADAKTPCKDASDILQAGRPGDIQTAVYSAKAWRPSGIVNAKDNREDAAAPKDEEGAFKFHWPWLDVELTLGPILPGQVCYHVAGTGIGKSTAITTIELGIRDQGGKVCHLSFEDTRREAKMRFMVIDVGKRLDIEPLDDEAMMSLHDKSFGGGWLELFDPETAEWTFSAIESYCYYAVKALGCQVIGVDPLSAIAALIDGSQDERKELDKISLFFAKLAKELGVAFQIGHHLSRPEGTAHEEGAATSLNQVRGSGGIANFATHVVGHERNQQAEGDDFLLTQLRSLKNRPRSKTGPMCVLRYDMNTGRLTITKEKFPAAGPAKGRGQQQAHGGGGFTPDTGGGDY
jgi:twinkle protein